MVNVNAWFSGVIRVLAAVRSLLYWLPVSVEFLDRLLKILDWLYPLRALNGKLGVWHVSYKPACSWTLICDWVWICNECACGY